MLFADVVESDIIGIGINTRNGEMNAHVHIDDVRMLNRERALPGRTFCPHRSNKHARFVLCALCVLLYRCTSAIIWCTLRT